MLVAAAAPVIPASPYAPPLPLGHIPAASHPYLVSLYGNRNRLNACVPLSAIVLTLNSERRLEEVLSSLHWCEEILVMDTGSTDRTMEIALRFPNVNLRRLNGPFPGFGLARREAVAAARHDWILSVDSDEVVSEALSREIRSLELNPRSVYSMPFHNFFNGKRIVSCGWGRERHERLFHRRHVNFGSAALHEGLERNGAREVKLSGPIRHYSYESMEAFLGKMRAYGVLFASQHAGRKRSSPMKALLRGSWTFFNSYLLQGGLIQGSEGLAISAYRGQTAFWKYFLLHEANQGRSR